MKLQKRLSRKIGKTVYVKWIVTVPPKNVEELGWKEGQLLESYVSDKSLVINKKEPKHEDSGTEEIV